MRDLKLRKITILDQSGRGIVLRFRKHKELIEKEVRLIPRWRSVGALMFSSLFAGAALALGSAWAGFTMLAVALVCLWAASR